MESLAARLFAEGAQSRAEYSGSFCFGEKFNGGDGRRGDARLIDDLFSGRRRRPRSGLRCPGLEWGRLWMLGSKTALQLKPFVDECR